MAAVAGGKAATRIPTELKNLWRGLEHEQPLNLLIVGKTGEGKSTLINNLVGKTVAKVNMASFEACTKGAHAIAGTFGGVEMRLWDTQGCRDGEESERAVFTGVRRGASRLHAVLVCVSMMSSRVTKDTIVTLQMVTEAFGAAVWQQAVVALTMANRVALAQASTSHQAPTGPWSSYQAAYDEHVRKLREVLVEQVHVHGDVVASVPFIPAGNSHARLPDLPDWRWAIWKTLREKAVTGSQRRDCARGVAPVVGGERHDTRAGSAARHVAPFPPCTLSFVGDRQSRLQSWRAGGGGGVRPIKVLVIGAPGTGKTSVAEALESAATTRPARFVDAPLLTDAAVGEMMTRCPFHAVVVCVPLPSLVAFLGETVEVMRILLKMFGAGLWQKVVIALTFANVTSKLANKDGHLGHYCRQIEHADGLINAQVRSLAGRQLSVLKLPIGRNKMPARSALRLPDTKDSALRLWNSCMQLAQKPVECSDCLS